MPHIDNEIVVDAPVGRVYSLARDVEGFPAFMPDVESVVVEERSHDGARIVTRWVGVAADFKLKVRWTEEDLWDDAALTCRFRQLHGDYQEYTGVWTFTAVDADHTRFHSEIDYVFEIPLIGPLLKKVVERLMRDNTQRLLEAIKARAESGAGPD
ncbi:MAG: type II toxin-antitoxin system RatA family toxin [Capsulimonadaceae bacterium]